MMFKRALIFNLSVFLGLSLYGQKMATVFGEINDFDGNPIEVVTITIPNTAFGTTSNLVGRYEIKVPAEKPIILKYSHTSYKPVALELNLRDGEKREINQVLEMAVEEISEVYIRELDRGSNLTRIEFADLERIPNSTGNIESILKLLGQGISASGELTSQYSVRGGNFDENLVYVNDIEVYRPFLVRSGQQEGLSFVNPNMVQSVKFSAGGFGANYGDKMSSVLDINYRTPKEFAGSASASLLGASAHLEGVSKNKKFTHISGLRYKTNKYLLNSLDTKGEYNPEFLDYQTYLTYSPNPKLEVSFLGNISSNKYNLIPQERETEFGSFQETQKLTIYYEGQETDQFDTYMGALSVAHRPNENLELKYIASGFKTTEKETYDLLGQYWINLLDNSPDSETFKDSILNIGVGTFLDHARNFLDAYIFSFLHKGAYKTDNNTFQWGVKFQNEQIFDRISEWEMIDSAGYSVPYSSSLVQLDHVYKSNLQLNTQRYSGYVQNTHEFDVSHGKLFFVTGARLNYWNFNQQYLFSPRVSLAYNPYWNNNLSFHLSGGYYYQPPFFKELRSRDGTLNRNLIAQKSIHLIAGGELTFAAWDRPFIFSAEFYYKHLDNLIPYHVENVRIVYSGKNQSVGYSTGIDFKLNGEFVPGAESWVGLSLMTIREDIIGDFYFDDNVKVYPGTLLRPTNQYMNFSLFFQDYFPNNPKFKVHVAMLYGSRVPVTDPNRDNYHEMFYMRPYKRIDFGISKSVFEDRVKKDHGPLKFVDKVWINAEIFNLFGFDNTSSYIWIKTVNNESGIANNYAIPNFLTPRRFNLKVSVDF